MSEGNDDAIHPEPGTTIRAQAVSIEARKFGKIEKFQKTHKHRGLRVKASKGVEIFIDEQFRLIRKKKSQRK